MSATKPKHDDPEKDTPSGARFIRTFQFNPEQYQPFEADLQRRGSSPSMMFKKLIVDYLGGRYVTLDNLPRSTVEALHKLAEDQHTGYLQPAIEAVLNEWAKTKAKKK